MTIPPASAFLSCSSSYLVCASLSVIVPFPSRGSSFPESATSFISTCKHAQGPYIPRNFNLPSNDHSLACSSVTQGVATGQQRQHCVECVSNVMQRSVHPTPTKSGFLCVGAHDLFNTLSSDSETHTFKKCCLDSMSLFLPFWIAFLCPSPRLPPFFLFSF